MKGLSSSSSSSSLIFTKLHPISYTSPSGATHLLPLPPKKQRSSAAIAMSAAVEREKVVVIMGPTGCGKTKLSIDLASKFFPSSEIINSDKIQAYRGLDITTNKVPLLDRRDVPHHLLGEFDPSNAHPEITASDFRASASRVISRATARRRLPFVVGGSNSFVHALLAERFEPEVDVFAGPESRFCSDLRYDCCFLWVDAAFPVLSQYIDKRVDDMLDLGMFEELSEYFEGLGPGRIDERGLNRAIGVPEFERYFRGMCTYEEAVVDVKDNTWELVKRQVEKIRRLREEAGWEMRRVDNTATLRAAVEGADAAEIWEKQVLGPSVKIVKQFLTE